MMKGYRKNSIDIYEILEYCAVIEYSVIYDTIMKRVSDFPVE